MVGPKAKKSAAKKVVEQFNVSTARACRVLGLNRSTFDYEEIAQEDSLLKERMATLVAKRTE